MMHLLSAFPTSVFSGLLIFCLSWWVITLVFSGLGGHGQAGHAGHSGGNDFSVHGAGGHASGGGHGAVSSGGAAGHAAPGHAGSGHVAGGHAAPTHTAPGDGHQVAGVHAAPHAGADGQHGQHGHHGHSDNDSTHGAHGFSHTLGFDVVPLPLILTLFAFGGWATSILMQTVLGTSATANVAAGTAVLIVVVAAVVGLGVIKVAAKPLGSVFEVTLAAERHEGVGSVCKIRTMTVTETFGDAIVITGTTKGSIVRVRAPAGRFARGDLALLIDYDEPANSFVIDELDEELRPAGA